MDKLGQIVDGFEEIIEELEASHNDVDTFCMALLFAVFEEKGVNLMEVNGGELEVQFGPEFFKITVEKTDEPSYGGQYVH